MATIFTAIGSGRGQEIWISHGTPSSTFLLKDVRDGASGSAPLFLNYLALNGALTPGRVLFLANDGTNGAELWVSDGTTAGTTLFKDINPGAAGSFASRWTLVGPRAVFTATDASNGNELWVSDGTAAGTVLLADLNPGAADSAPVFIGSLIAGGTADPSRAMFLLDDGTTGREIWVTDGTAAGTAQLKDINPGAGGANATAWTAVNGRAVFSANDGAAGQELWVSNGTGAGTTLLTNAAAGLAGSDPEILGYLLVGGVADTTKLLVSLDDITHGRELWVTDGTPGGTVLFKDLDTGSAGSTPEAWTAVNGRAVFAASTAAAGRELWVSDGTANGTVLLADARPGAAGSDPVVLGPLLVNGVADTTRLLVAMDNGTNGTELWVTNGTPGGTALFKDLNPGAPGSDPGPWTAVNGRAVFVADSAATGRELWVSDGTASGTTLLLDAQPGAIGSAPTLLGPLSVNGAVDPTRLLFLLDDGTAGQELWVTDGTQTGTTLFKDANAGALGSFAVGRTEITMPLIDLSAAPVGVTLALGEAGTAQNVSGSPFNDTFTGNAQANLINGRDGQDTVVFSQPRENYQVGILGTIVRVDGPDGPDELRNIELLKFGEFAAITVDSLRGQPETDELYQNLVDGELRFGLPTRYVGPAAVDYILPADNGSDVLQGTSRRDFANLGAGNDAASMGAGNDVLDGGGGSNFLTGGEGIDTFFIDGRDLVPVWSCITDWQPGEALTVWGWRDGVSLAAWSESDGLPGYLGATMFADIDGNGLVETAITWTGVALADLPKQVAFDVSGIGVLYFS